MTAITMLVLGLSAVAQSGTSSSRSRIIPAVVLDDPARPFDSRHDAAIPPVTLRPASEMSRGDQDLLANAESVIQEKAGFESLDFNQSGWTYQQIVCPALPNHLLLRFSRDDGSRQMSMFSAAIPRNGEGKVRLIPIVRRGYSLFSPAPINALTISAFNHIRTEEPSDRAPDWLETGLCYAALTGGDPDWGSVHPMSSSDPEVPLVMTPTIHWEPQGGAVVEFSSLAANARHMLWSMSFDRKGILLKAKHTPAELVTIRPLPKTADVEPALASPASKQ